ncbi:MAG: XDD4 family exosortase-dependent surface protein [Planctomycetaceae bacterium]
MKNLSVCVLGVVLLSAIAGRATAGQITFTWGDAGLHIVGERPEFIPTGSAVFDITGSTLTITLTNDSPQQMQSIGEVLSGIAWDITDSTVVLTKLTATIPAGSRLFNPLHPATDLSGEWGFKDDLDAGLSSAGPLGAFGISSVGDVNFGFDTFGPNDRFDPSQNLFGPPSGSLNGADASIVGAVVDFTKGGFQKHGPVVQGWDGTNAMPGQVVFNFSFTGDLTEDDITNVIPFFGTDGAVLAPEPSSIALLGIGAISLFGYGRRRRRVQPR